MYDIEAFQRPFFYWIGQHNTLYTSSPALRNNSIYFQVSEEQLKKQPCRNISKFIHSF